MKMKNDSVSCLRIAKLYYSLYRTKLVLATGGEALYNRFIEAVEKLDLVKIYSDNVSLPYTSRTVLYAQNICFQFLLVKE